MSPGEVPNQPPPELEHSTTEIHMGARRLVEFQKFAHTQKEKQKIIDMIIISVCYKYSFTGVSVFG